MSLKIQQIESGDLEAVIAKHDWLSEFSEDTKIVVNAGMEKVLIIEALAREDGLRVFELLSKYVPNEVRAKIQSRVSRQRERNDDLYRKGAM